MKQLERAPHSAAMLCMEGAAVAGPGGLCQRAPIVLMLSPVGQGLLCLESARGQPADRSPSLV